MKHIYLLLTSLVIAFFAVACNEYENYFPDSYLKVLSIKNSGIWDRVMSNTVDEYEDSVLVLKGGGCPESESHARLQVMNLEETCEEYGYSADMIQIIPEDSYDLSSDKEITIGAKESHKYVQIRFAPKIIHKEIQKSDDKIMVLPLVLKSETDTVNTTHAKVLYKIDVKSPSINWSNESLQKESIDFMSGTVPIEVNILFGEVNPFDVHLKIDQKDNTQLVQDYNDQMGTNYELLPDIAVQLPELYIAAGQNFASTEITISRKEVISNHHYLLPLKLLNEEIEKNQINTTDIVKYIQVEFPKYACEQIDRKDWKAIYASSQDQWLGSLNEGKAWFAPNILDGDVLTTWSANWNGTPATSDDYDYSGGEMSKYIPHNLIGLRNVPNIIIVVDLGKEEAVGAAALQFGSAPSDMNDIIDCEYYVSTTMNFKTVKDGGDFNNYSTLDDDNDWKLVVSVKDIPNDKDLHWFYAGTHQIGRYLKIRPMKVRREGFLCNIGEVYLKRVLAIDGVRIEQYEPTEIPGDYNPDNWKEGRDNWLAGK